VIIGPNAKVATYHGGGSASLAAYYAVTPFDGISSKLSSPPTFSQGAYSHKLLPMLGLFVTGSSGNPGMTMKAYREPPEVVDRQLRDQLDVVKTDMLLVDYKNPKIGSNLWYADLEGSFVVDEDCEWEFGCIVAGTAKLYVNGDLVVDNESVQRQGNAFFGAATIEERGRAKLQKGETCNVKVVFGSAPTSKLTGRTVLFGSGALRIGGCKVINEDEEISKAAALAKDAEQVVICTGLNADWETEGVDRDTMDLPGRLDDLVSAVATANPNTVVVMQSGTPVQMPWINKVPSVVQAWYGGNETGNVIADILFGDVNPSGKLSLSFPIRLQDNPTYLNFRAEGGRTLYGEDVYIGYRYYEYVDREVLFPFGHGLSYTEFEFSNLKVTERDGKLSVSVTVKNTGAVKGAEVVQVYISPKQKAKVNRPVKEMKGFTKVALASSESKAVTIDIQTKYATGYWDEERNKWITEKGKYGVIVSNSSEIKEDKALHGEFDVAATTWWSGI
jgi:beta-glucosidase